MSSARRVVVEAPAVTLPLAPSDRCKRQGRVSEFECASEAPLHAAPYPDGDAPQRRRSRGWRPTSAASAVVVS